MRLTMYLLREGTSGTVDALRTKASPEPLTVRSPDGVALSAFRVRGAVRLPAWVTDVNVVADYHDPTDDLIVGQSLGAVILVERNDRIFAITFGTGFHAIEPSLIERGFGLRVAANIVAANAVRGAQTRGVASNSRDQKTLLPTDGSFNELDVEIDEDWLRELSGKAADRTFASSLSGSDSLRITVPDFTLREIGEKLDRVLELYQSQAFKVSYPFLDQITPVDRSDEIIALLDAEVVSQLWLKNESVMFAAPDPFEQPGLDHYEVTANRVRYSLGDLDASAMMSIVETLDRSRDPLCDITIYALNGDGDLVDRAHALKAYVQTEVKLEGVGYLLSAGLWFAIRTDFVEQINRQIAAIPDISTSLDLPIWKAAELKSDDSDATPEGSYNKLVATIKGYGLLDKKLVHFGRNERLEVSDLLTPDGELLCVKTASSSGTLSHLVAQAVNSSKAWGAPEYKAVLKPIWEDLKGAGASMERSQFTFVLAIATSKPGPLAESLFLFAKVQIASLMREITRNEFKVALARIPMEEVVAEKVERKRRKVEFV